MSDGIGEALETVVTGTGEAMVALADLLQDAVWMGRSARNQHDAGQPRIETEKGPQDDRRAG